MKDPYTFIFAGRSGCGKGTQAKLLKEYLKSQDSNIEIFEYSTGDGFRSFIEGDSYSSNLARDIQNRGELQPLFLTISMWASAFRDKLKSGDTIFIDGYPRVEAESIAVVSALGFYSRKTPIIIDFNVSRESSKERMEKRGRADDTPENIEKRLNWYDRDVVPAIEYLKRQDGYIYWEVDGERPIEPIHEDIISRIKELNG
jgi:adenylate kinase